MWMTEAESNFLLSHINPQTTMLEWGSGASTVELQHKVKKLVSIEHNLAWYNEIKPQLSNAVHYKYIPPDNPDWEAQLTLQGSKTAAADDGDLMDFSAYVTYPLRLIGKFDLILIDGRARAACALVSPSLLASGGKILIHDFGPDSKHPRLGFRRYYQGVLNYLDIVDYRDTLYAFRPKYT